VRFFEETYGCTMNQGESRELVDTLISLGHEKVDSIEEAELVLVNTCVVIRPTELKIMKRLRSLNQMGKRMIIAGCIPAVNSAALMEEFPDALLLDPPKYPFFREMVMDRLGLGTCAPARPERQTSGILPISQGCLGNCTYCLTKAARGDLSSYSVDAIVEKAKAEIAEGSKELFITAQDTGCYGFDKDSDIALLLSALSSLDGRFFIRVGMMNPDSLEPVIDKAIDAWASPKVYKFLHLPVQSGSASVLSAMGRMYSPSIFESQVQRFRSKYPRMSIATDIITGFPGETEEDHELSKELLLRSKPNVVNVTRFSPRPGTPAARAKDQVPSWVSKERSREMTKLRFEIASEHYSKFVGDAVPALVAENGKPGTMVVRTIEYAPVAVPSNGIRLGDMVTVEITESTATHLLGKVVQ